MYRTSNAEYGNYYRLIQQKDSQKKIGSSYSSSGQQSSKKIGLSNIGNSCYINTVLQCIYNSKDVNSMLRDIGHIDFTRGSKLLQAFLVIWFKVTQAIIEPDLEDLNDFREQLGTRCSTFANIYQHDAVEFFQILLELLSKDLMSMFPSKRKLNALQMQNDTAWNIYSEQQLSRLNIIYTGQIANKLTCLACKYEETNYDYFCNLSVFIPQTSGKISVYHLLQEYFRPEHIDQTKNCKKCQKQTQITKSSVLMRLPQQFVIQLKRYNYYKQLDQPLKELEVVSIEPSINIHSICNQKENPKNCNYVLTGVINHQGIIQSGHYTCLIRDLQKGSWYSYNDTRVSEITNEFLQNELGSSRHSYVLFYENT